MYSRVVLGRCLRAGCVEGMGGSMAWDWTCGETSTLQTYSDSLLLGELRDRVIREVIDIDSLAFFAEIYKIKRETPDGDTG